MIKSIQLLRAIAALAVVFYHVHFYHLETGTFGVDIFFIISGFIIAYMVNQTTRHFIIKRIIRVVPLYTLATLLTVALALAEPKWFNHAIVNAGAMAKSLFYIPYRIKESGPILSSGWTLNDEMFFYGAMFLCILLFKKKGMLVPACGVLLILLLLILNSFSESTIAASGYGLRFYRNGLLPEFIYGLALYYFRDYYDSRQTKTISVLMISAGLAAFALIIYFDLNHIALGLPRNIRYGIPALLFVNSFLTMENRISEKNRFVKAGLKLGDASYAMYLFHPFVIYFLLRLVYPKIIGRSSSLITGTMELTVSLVLVALVSVLIYELVDKPMTKFFKKRLKKYNEVRAARLAAA